MEIFLKQKKYWQNMMKIHASQTRGEIIELQFDFFGNALLALATFLYSVVFSSVVLNKNRRHQ